MNQKPISTNRLDSIDALRGFDMLMISGGGEFIHLLGGLTGIGIIDAIAGQFYHPEWHGFTFYDFIFPLFLFLAGTSLAFSVTSGKARGVSNPDLIKKVAKRMVILMLLGILFKNAPLDIFDPSHIRYGSVLGRIGIATFLTTLLYLRFSWKQRLYIGVGVLVAYYLILLLIPVPGFGTGNLTFEGNLVGWLDRAIMPGKLKQITYDELAVSTQIPAACMTVFGSLAGDILLGDRSGKLKVRQLLVMGAAGIAAGLLWNIMFPINKHLWSSSFVLLTSGMAGILLAVFYWIIDVKGHRSWSFFFRVIGVNSLLIYLVTRFIDFNESSRLLFFGIYKYTTEPWQEVFNALGGFVLVWLFLYILYRKKLFLKV
ncbi:putative acyltransferase [Dyadobacter jejuensis]|uniref:Putative acyltransferase n=1 Tax=Dyadobacter jejuensis TaxID=1082580 RepID=A0A316AMF2_9BACT|nr:DUF5009 domain-containing protein [Dyadobacter jejuensis]PWJ58741.1 putative acyltransferase [Dyadobacter jejuensis]